MNGKKRSSRVYLHCIYQKNPTSITIKRTKMYMYAICSNKYCFTGWGTPSWEIVTVKELRWLISMNMN